MKIFLSIIATVSLFASTNISHYYVKNQTNNLLFVIQGKDIPSKNHSQIFINSDNNKKTGYSDESIKGADYLIEDNKIYKSLSNGNEWKWEDTGLKVKKKNYKNRIVVHLKKNSILLYPYINSKAALMDKNWDNYSESKEYFLGVHKKNITKYLKKFYEYWKDTYLVKEKDGTYRVAFDKNDKSQTVSEGQGFGMLIVATMAIYDENAQEIFDGLYKFAKAHPSKIAPHLMAWIYPESDDGEDSAFDGDADIAYALILAHKIWGDKGEINYKQEAKTILNDIYTYTIGPESKLPLLGDWVNPNGKKYNQYSIRSSDLMLEHFREYAKFTKDDKWLEVLNASKELIKKVSNKDTALLPDFIVKKDDKFQAAPKNFLEGKHDGDYHYNACRTPWRIGIYALMSGDSQILDYLNKFTNWITNSIENVSDIKSGYKLDGEYYGDYFSTAFASPIEVGVLASNKKLSDNIFNYTKEIKENYYEDSINLLSMIAINGNYYVKKAKKK